MDLVFLALLAAIIALIGLWALLCLFSAIRKNGLIGTIKGFFKALSMDNDGHKRH